jgi:hypothetical protein
MLILSIDQTIEIQYHSHFDDLFITNKDNKFFFVDFLTFVFLFSIMKKSSVEKSYIKY